MDYILKSRGRGKTYDLIQRSAKTGERILCSTITSAKYVNSKAREMGVNIPEAMFYKHYDSERFNDNGVMIDELSSLLRTLLNCKVNAVTDTPDNILVDTKDLSDKPSMNMNPVTYVENLTTNIEHSDFLAKSIADTVSKAIMDKISSKM